jgi:excisionase family DNA binding protein
MSKPSTCVEALAPPDGPNRAARRHPERGFIGLQGAAAYLDVNPMTIRRMIARGQLTGYRLGGASGRLIKVRVADLDALMSPIGAA